MECRRTEHSKVPREAQRNGIQVSSADEIDDAAAFAAERFARGGFSPPWEGSQWGGLLDKLGVTIIA